MVRLPNTKHKFKFSGGREVDKKFKIAFRIPCVTSFVVVRQCILVYASPSNLLLYCKDYVVVVVEAAAKVNIFFFFEAAIK